MKNVRKTILTLTCVLILTSLISCGQDETVLYREADHGSWIEEFGPHDHPTKKVDGWWFMNGNLTEVDDPSKEYNIFWAQYNMRTAIYGIPMYMLMRGLTDLQTEEVYYVQNQSIIIPGIYANGNEVKYEPYSLFKRNEDSFDLSVNIPEKGVSYDLNHDFGKGPTWHGDNGVMTMGVSEDPNMRTVYYSFTRMPTTGTLTVPDGAGGTRTVAVEGECWLERQWGPFLDFPEMPYWTYEWASLRFFDNEEIMLFSYPQHNNWLEGTYIRADGSSQHLLGLEGFTYEPYDFFLADMGIELYESTLLMNVPFPSNILCFGEKWELTIPGIKEENYRLEPYIPGFLYGAFAEMGADIINDDGEVVGQAFVEAIPLLRNGMCDE